MYIGATADDEIVGRIGYYLPMSVFGATLAAIANGLVSTFSTSTSTGRWIGYQIILGVGRGMAMQMVSFYSPRMLPLLRKFHD
jgi:hypothetical protein